MPQDSEARVSPQSHSLSTHTAHTAASIDTVQSSATNVNLIYYFKTDLPSWSLDWYKMSSSTNFWLILTKLYITTTNNTKNLLNNQAIKLLTHA